jgi:hypothetical protein
MKSYALKNRSVSPKPLKKYLSGVSAHRKKLLNDWISVFLPKLSNSVEEMIKTGQIPYKLLQVFCPTLSIKGIQSTPNHSQAFNNLLLINNFIFSEFPDSDLPAPSEVLRKGSSDCWVLINSIFSKYQMREVKKNWEKCVEWFRSILKLYDIEVIKTNFNKECASGVYFACVLNCYSGFRLTEICRKPKQDEALRNLTLVFTKLREKVFIPLTPEEFFKNSQDDWAFFTIFEVFKGFRFEVPSLPTREKVQFKTRPQLVLDPSESLISISSWESLEYSKSTILSQEPSEAHIQVYRNTTPKWTKEKVLEIITDDSTGYSMQPNEVTDETVNTSYSKSTTERIKEKICLSERRPGLEPRLKKDKLFEVPSLKSLRFQSKQNDPDFLCFLITPRLLKMLQPDHNNFVFSVVMDFKSPAMKQEDYFFEWKDFSLVLRGKIKVSEISACETTGRILYISTYNKDLVIQCLDDKESSAYAHGLSKLSKPKTLFSRDVSCNELISNIH